MSKMASEYPFFSVIIPTYNRAVFIKSAIESVLNQTCRNFELIIIDDASTDNTGEIVSGFNDSRIKYLKNEYNIERSASRNRGINEARGQYICFLDSDDCYRENHLEEFYREIEKNNFPVAMFYSDCLIKCKDGNILEYNNNNKQNFRNNIELVFHNIITSQRVCIHKSILEKYQYNPTITIGEDTELWIRILKEYPLYYVDKRTVVICEHSERTVDISNNKAFISHLALMKNIVKNDNENFISKKVRKEVLSYSYFTLARHYEYKKQKGRMIASVLKSILIQPNQKIKEKLFMFVNNFSVLKYLHVFIKKIYR